MSHTISTVDDDTRQCALLDWSRGPTGGESQHRLHGNVEPRYVECLEHDFGRILAILGRVERRFREQEMMIARLGAQILKDALLEESFHQVPIFDDSVPDGILKDKRSEHNVGVAPTQISELTFTAYPDASKASSPMKKSKSSTPFVTRRAF